MNNILLVFQQKRKED